MFPLLGDRSRLKESLLLKEEEELDEARIVLPEAAVEDPLKIQRVSLVGLSWLG